MNRLARIDRWTAYLAAVFFVLIALTAFAYAQGAPPQPPGVDLLNLVVTLGFAFLVPVVGAVGVYVAGWVKAKTGVDLTTQITQTVDLAVGFAEQQARKHAATAGAKLPGQDKLGIAMPWLMTMAEHQKWPAWARSQAENLIEARLGQRPAMEVNIKRVEVGGTDVDKVVREFVDSHQTSPSGGR